ncbi:hypothetical protein [Kushneria aurantia]|uniref:Uncharacterized protein n=1 Tax=Kushneria aurantia TaxID=504092 RepID=A0ABV6G1W9_9GAMM|nr:hypothetical protein [Kushneria aurantia]
MESGDELVVPREELPEHIDVGAIFHLDLRHEDGTLRRCALLLRETGPLEALCDVLAVENHAPPP